MLNRKITHLLCLILFLMISSQAWSQQNSNQPPKLKATVTEIKQQGRTQILVVTNDEGQTLEIPLSRVAVDIKAKGDNGFIREGVYIGAVGVTTNNMLFVKTVNVLLPVKSQKVPRGKVGKAPRRAGISQNSLQISGTITAAKPNPDYPDYMMLAIDAPGKYPTINLEKNYTVNVVSMDKSMVKVGMKVELEGRVNRGKFLTSKVTVNRTEPFKSSEVFGAAEEDKLSTK